jgi:S-disulfanyl-L-cysteine oxidoreductase SoxD
MSTRNTHIPEKWSPVFRKGYAPSKLLLALLVASLGGAALAQSPKLGKPIAEGDIAAWDVAAMPDGRGLPDGKGTAVEGAKMFAEKCVACHGEGGKGVPNVTSSMVGGQPLTNGIDTPKTIGNFIGYSTIVFDFVRRAMPYPQPRSLTSDEVYALTAYLLYINKIIGETDVMDKQSLPKVKMPNRDNFIIAYPDRI